MKSLGIFLLLSFTLGATMAQAPKPAPMKTGKNDTIRTYVTELDGQYVPWIVTGEVKIVDSRIFASEADRAAYNQLVYNVHKVMPYARFAGERYRQLQRDLAVTDDKHKQKELVEACNNQIKDLFKREIENLTISQGEVLIKLIDRETGNTSYELVSQLKGGFHAFAFQQIARLFGHNLKETYDPDEDRDIEYILQKAGYDSSKNN